MRKEELAEALQILERYKARLTTNPTEKSLKNAMEKLHGIVQSDFFSALTEIVQYYEMSLANQTGGVHDRVAQRGAAAAQPPPIRPKPKLQMPPLSSSAHSSSAGSSVVAANQNTDSERRSSIASSNTTGTAQSSSAMMMQHGTWHTLHIELWRGKRGYGFSVAGGTDFPHYEEDPAIYVTEIAPENCAAEDGRMALDDMIVAVNGVSLARVTHAQAVEALKSAGSRMQLELRRFQEDSAAHSHTQSHTDTDATDTERDRDGTPQPSLPPPPPPIDEAASVNDAFEYFEVTLKKRLGTGLGFSIQGGALPANKQQDEGASQQEEEDQLVTVSKISAKGLAAESGRMQVGDVILRVNGVELADKTHDQVVEMMRRDAKKLVLLLCRPRA